MSIGLPCTKCGGIVVHGKHVMQSGGCGTKEDAQVVRLNPTGKETLNDMLDNVVSLMKMPSSPPPRVRKRP